MLGMKPETAKTNTAFVNRALISRTVYVVGRKKGQTHDP